MTNPEAFLTQVKLRRQVQIIRQSLLDLTTGLLPPETSGVTTRQAESPKAS